MTDKRHRENAVRALRIRHVGLLTHWLTVCLPLHFSFLQFSPFFSVLSLRHLIEQVSTLLKCHSTVFSTIYVVQKVKVRWGSNCWRWCQRTNAGMADDVVCANFITAVSAILTVRFTCI